MRATIHKYLADKCQTVHTWLQPHRPHKIDPKNPQPWGVIEIGEETPAPFNRAGRFQSISVWLYFPEGSFVPVDAAVDEVKRLLHNAELTGTNGRRFALEWDQTMRDYYDPDLQAVGKRIDFRIPRGG